MNQLELETRPHEISYSNDQLPRKRRATRPEIQQPDDPFIRYIALTHGQIAIVDTFLYDWLMQWNWYVRWNRRSRRFCSFRWNNISMHRQILGLKQGDPRQGDHQNRNSLDNRGANLRPGDATLNAVNHNLQRNNKSGFRGVWRTGKNCNRWKSSGKHNGKRVYFGSFGSPEEAAKVRDIAVLEEYGNLAIPTLNFPELIDEYRAELERRNETSR